MHYILIILIVLSGSVFAADPETEFGQQFLERQKQERERQYLENKQENLQVIPTSPDLPSEDVCFDIENIQINGNTLLNQQDILFVLEKYRGQCLGKNGVNYLMQDLTAVYVQKGYITTRVYIPPQDLNLGTLKLIVIEGEVEGVILNDGEESDSRKLWWAMPSLSKELFLPDIEQGLDQINRVRSASATMKLWPGSEPGLTKIQIVNQTDDEFRGEVELNNDGQEDTGKTKVRVGLEADNILGINDSTSINYIGSQNTNALAATASFPYRYSSFNFSHSYSEYLNILPEQTDLFGQSNTSTFSWDYLLFRDSSMRVNLVNSLSVRRSERYLLGVKLSPQKIVPYRVSINVSENLPWGYYSMELAAAHGSKWFGATSDPSQLPDSAPHAQFSKVEWRSSIAKSVTSLGSYQVSLNGQYSDKGLYSSEQVHIGDRSSVRGGETTIASGDSGFYIRNDFNINVPAAGLRQIGVSIRPSVFIDYGHVFADENSIGEEATGGDSVSMQAINVFGYSLFGHISLIPA
ncbi:hypothetical protein CHH28_07885 [Bacterioplanes sanyensis]|uniref:POTRA domain-containing protein n=1 Tax=Bacterioplanes sanyensis TaxID=1249553 RepID=A0A222FIJ9_9GAMM|nr:ShlB/FhaC/HecB family hemolysin secretion/activation protein [Bacterioplanes sanyensis]ASP38600.1 hypothetical protein CHH28_07885 [Bacterioplanes sanyensis]